METVSRVKQIRPVLPVLTKKDQTVPFITCEEMIAL